MVRCNLSVLLAERNLKITKVCKDTGISRTTLTYLSNNYSKGIQYDTLNTLCAYLNVGPGELISYAPVDISHLHIYRTGDKYEQLKIDFELTFNGITKKCNLCGNAYLYFSNHDAPNFDKEKYPQIPYEVEIDIDLLDPDGDAEFEAENQFIINAFQALPVTFIKDLENEITGTIINDISQEYRMEGCAYNEPMFISFRWSYQIQSAAFNNKSGGNI